MIKAILWDNDGVLVETEHLYFEATQHVLATIGVTLTREQYLELFLTQGRGAWHLAEARGLGAAELDVLRDARNRLYAEWLPLEPRVMPGVADVLASLHGQYVMGVVTSSRRDHFDLIHQSSGLLPYFDFLVTADDVRHVKPDPESYRHAVERTGFSSDVCLAIEDSERGLQAALGAGVRCVVVPTALTRGAAFVGAHRVLGSLAELAGIL
jgi:HAD superfamily hydrolase (TIGR01509 family)